jgi:alcohol dehydrogenase, propanol-preferring
MKAMILPQIVSLHNNPHPLIRVDFPEPNPKDDEILVKVSACGVCHTELDEIEGRTPPPFFPVIPGHQVVGRVIGCGAGTTRYKNGDRVGIGWIHSACGRCSYCASGLENLCANFKASGRDAHGGYAEYMTVPENFAFPIPDNFTDMAAAPLLCAGAIGYRSLALTGLVDGRSLGLTGFGASGHLVLQMVREKFPNSPVFVFARSGKEREFALELGAVWAGDTDDMAPEQLRAVIDTTPVWKPVVSALANLAPGGRLVINAIRKETLDQDQLLHLDYPVHLWMEKEIKSVANVTRQDIADFLELAAAMSLAPEVEPFSLFRANEALLELKERKIRGAKVLLIDE